MSRMANGFVYRIVVVSQIKKIENLETVKLRVTAFY